MKIERGREADFRLANRCLLTTDEPSREIVRSPAIGRGSHHPTEVPEHCGTLTVR